MTTVAEPQRGTREASPVLAFVGRRLLGAVGALFVASLLIFAGTAILPGDAASVVLGRGATPQAVKELDQQLHLDRPLVTQYTTWLGGFIHGDLGDSSVGLAQGQKDAPVWDLISSPVKNSLILALVTAIFMIPLSLGLGALAAVYAGRPVDHAISIGSLAAIALPEFVIGSLLIGVFFVWLDVLPPVALIPPGENPLSHPSEARAAGGDAPPGIARRRDPDGARGDGRGAPDGVRPDRPPERPRRAVGAVALRDAKRARAERAGAGPEPPVADRRDHHHRERLRLSRGSARRSSPRSETAI